MADSVNKFPTKCVKKILPNSLIEILIQCAK